MNNPIENRYEVIALVQAKMCNPNGDPDMGNRVRQDFETNRGIITDVAFKSRIRQYVEAVYENAEGMEILISNGASINRAIAAAVLEANDVDAISKKDNKKAAEASNIMANRYWDVRTFGGVLSTGLNAGQVQGAVQIGMSLSVDPIDPEDIAVTRKAYSTADKKKFEFPTLAEYDEADAELSDDQKRTMGRKTFIPYGLYVMKATVSANLARKVGFSEEDLKILLDAILQMYEIAPSASKMGMSVVGPLMIFKHVGTQADKTSDQNKREALLGCASAGKLFDLLEINRKPDVEYPRDISDYEIAINKSDIPNGVELYFKTQPFADMIDSGNMDHIDMIHIK